MTDFDYHSELFKVKCVMHLLRSFVPKYNDDTIELSNTEAEGLGIILRYAIDRIEQVEENLP